MSKKCAEKQNSNEKNSNKNKRKNRNKKQKNKEKEARRLKPKKARRNKIYKVKTECCDIKIEDVADIPLLIGVMVQMGLVEILDKHIPTHWKQRNLSWGWTSVIWLGYVLSEEDHRKVAVEAFIHTMKDTLTELAGQEVNPHDFTDDRLSKVLKYLSKKSYWEKIEKELNERTITVYELPTKVVRCDATTVSGCHAGKSGSLFQFGNSKDNPELRQVKVMTGSLDPLGMPLATDVVSGEQADDKLYVPVIDRINDVVEKDEVIYVGDCKMAAASIRLHIRGLSAHYLMPLPLTGKTKEEMPVWIEEGIARLKNSELTSIYKKTEDGEEVFTGQGYEFERKCSGVENENKIEWTERVLVVMSSAYAEKQQKGLEQRLENAEEKIKSLTPARARGKRQIENEEKLKGLIEEILKTHKVEGLLGAEYEKEVERQEKYEGKGRGAKHRKKKTVERIRYQIVNTVRNEEKIKEAKEKFGWRAYVTDVAKDRLDLGDAVRCYRKEYRVERIFSRLKSHLNIAPYFVKKDNQVKGMTNFLTLGVRVLTLTEYVVRRSLKKDNAALGGLHPENKRKETAKPTAERLLKAFSGVKLSITKEGEKVCRHLTPLSELQKEILRRLGLSCSLYENLEIKNREILLSE